MEETEFNKPSEQKPKSKGKMILALAVIVLIVLGVVLYFTWPAAEEEDTPPTLELSSGNLQGAFVDEKIGFLNIEAQDVKDWQLDANREALGKSTVKRNIHFYWSKSPISVQGVIDSMKPVEGNRILIAYYSPGEGDLSKGYYTYPVGPFENTITIEDPSDFIIPAYRGFVIISQKETDIYGIKSEEDVSDKFPKPLQNNETGWVLVPVTSEPTGALNSYGSRMEKLWPQHGDNKFGEKNNIEDVDMAEGYSMIWIYLSEQESIS